MFLIGVTDNLHLESLKINRFVPPKDKYSIVCQREVGPCGLFYIVKYLCSKFTKADAGDGWVYADIGTVRQIFDKSIDELVAISCGSELLARIDQIDVADVLLEYGTRDYISVATFATPLGLDFRDSLNIHLWNSVQDDRVALVPELLAELNYDKVSLVKELALHGIQLDHNFSISVQEFIHMTKLIPGDPDNQAPEQIAIFLQVMLQLNRKYMEYSREFEKANDDGLWEKTANEFFDDNDMLCFLDSFLVPELGQD